MNDTPQPRLIGVDDLLTRTGNKDHDGLAVMTTDLMNLLVDIVGPLRASEPGLYDAPLISAMIVYAGIIHGELMGIGVAPDMTPEALTALLTTNWTTGRALGLKRVQDARVAMAAAEGEGVPRQ